MYVDKSNLFAKPEKDIEELKKEKLRLLDEMEKREEAERNKQPIKSFTAKFEDNTEAETDKMTFVNEN